ncbi:MAG: DUF58 domain-containing protein [Candidatus Hydrothermarchaeota archaeon]|nr:DUF58 domain-containing protein [Candidatus Hydrothermarchaeota archaeon]
MIGTDFFKELDRFSFMIRKRVSSVYSGARRSIRQGKGIDIYDFREYFPGDDIKSVDWKLYSRTERLYIRRFEEEKNLTTHILVDSSKSMDFNGKFDYAAMIAAGFAYLITKENEKFSLATYSEDLKNVMQSRKGKKHFLNAIELLNGTKLDGRTKLETCAERYSSVIKSRSLVVLISDFLESLASIQRGIYKLARRNELIVIQILDAKEKNLDWLGGDTKVYDMESSEVMRTYISPRFKAEHEERFADHIHGIRKVCREVDADFFSITTDIPVFNAFLEFSTVLG